MLFGKQEVWSRGLKVALLGTNGPFAGAENGTRPLPPNGAVGGGLAVRQVSIVSERIGHMNGAVAACSDSTSATHGGGWRVAML